MFLPHRWHIRGECRVRLWLSVPVQQVSPFDCKGITVAFLH